MMGITMEGRIIFRIVDPVTTGLLDSRRAARPLGLGVEDLDHHQARKYIEQRPVKGKHCFLPHQKSYYILTGLVIVERSGAFMSRGGWLGPLTDEPVEPEVMNGGEPPLLSSWEVPWADSFLLRDFEEGDELGWRRAARPRVSCKLFGVFRVWRTTRRAGRYTT